jgi:hypothetical protein
MNQKLRFNAILLKHPKLDASYIEFPFDTMERYGKKGQVKVKALIDGKVEYRGSLANMGLGCHVLGITKEIRKQINKTYGDTLEIELEQDLEARIVSIPAIVGKAFAENIEAKTFFATLSYTNQKESMNWIDSAKKPETRDKRLGEMIILLRNRKRLNEQK